MRRPFVVLWLATLLFYLGFQLLLPVIPLYAARLGAGEAHVGFIIGVFALAAMVPRPIAGDLADRIGRRPLVLLGTAIFALAPLGYAAVGTIPGLLVLRLFHGTGMGLGPTAATVIATDLTSPERRGAAMGVYGLASAVALAVGPYLGGELVRRLGFTRTFLVATGIEAGLSPWRGPCRRHGPLADSPRLRSEREAGQWSPGGGSRASGTAGSARPRSTRRGSSWRSTSRTAVSPRSCPSSPSGASWGTQGSSSRSTPW